MAFQGSAIVVFQKRLKIRRTNFCIQRTRRLRFVPMLNVFWRRVGDARRSTTS